MTLADRTLADYLADIAARTSTPGGGAVAAIIAAEACALIAMVAEFTKSETVAGLTEASADARRALLRLADEDGAAFKQVMTAYRGTGNLEAALAGAARVPVQVLACCEQQVASLNILAAHGNPNLSSDTGIAALLLKAAVGACEINIRINVRNMKETVPGDIDGALARIPALEEALDTIAALITSDLS